MKPHFCFLVFFLALFIACDNEELTPDKWKIEGTVAMSDTNVPEIKTPLEGIKLYLLNVPFSIDTLTSWVAASDIADSTISGADGQYLFDAVTPGKYAVLPFDSTYSFQWEEYPDSVFTVSEELEQSEFEANFIAPELLPENSSSIFKFIFYCEGEFVSNEYWAQIVIFRKTRARTVYWDWGPKIGWGDWYWSDVTGGDYLNPGYHAELKMYEPKDASGLVYQYKDEFLIKFYIHHWITPFTDPIYTYKIDYLRNVNEFDVNWISTNEVEVSRHY